MYNIHYANTYKSINFIINYQIIDCFAHYAQRPTPNAILIN